MNRNCKHYDFGDTAPSTYGAYCKKHKMFFYDKKSENGKITLPDCKQCTEYEVLNGKECESGNDAAIDSTSTSSRAI